jgi:citrate synthase
MEVTHLLLYGELPTKKELIEFEDMIVSEMLIHSKLIEFYNSFKSEAHPMAIMMGVVGALSAFDKKSNSYDMTTKEREDICIKLIAKMPMIAAYAYRMMTRCKTGRLIRLLLKLLIRSLFCMLTMNRMPVLLL